MYCKQLLKNQVKEFKAESGDHYVPCKPTLEQEMPQLKYNACSEGYRHDAISKAELIDFFGQELFDEVALCAFEYDNDL